MSDQKKNTRRASAVAPDAEYSLGLLLNTRNKEPDLDKSRRDLLELFEHHESHGLIEALEQWEEYFLYNPPEGNHQEHTQSGSFPGRLLLNRLRTYQRACLVASVRAHMNPTPN